jgi:hypothetical protein
VRPVKGREIAAEVDIDLQHPRTVLMGLATCSTTRIQVMARLISTARTLYICWKEPWDPLRLCDWK